MLLLVSIDTNFLFISENINFAFLKKFPAFCIVFFSSSFLPPPPSGRWSTLDHLFHLSAHCACSPSGQRSQWVPRGKRQKGVHRYGLGWASGSLSASSSYLTNVLFPPCPPSMFRGMAIYSSSISELIWDLWHRALVDLLECSWTNNTSLGFTFSGLLRQFHSLICLQLLK